MNKNHFSTADVAMFREDNNSLRSIEIGRHLLVCSECRTKLPSVAPEVFRACVLDSSIPANLESKPLRVFAFSDFPKLWPVVRTTAFAGLAILLTAGISFVGFSWLNSSENTIAKKEDDLFSKGPVEASSVKTPTYSNTRPAEKIPLKSDGPSKSRAASIKSDQKSVGSRAVQIGRAETRGNENVCSGGAVINLESDSSANEVFLKWNAVKSAVSYAVYISDLDENLVDRFESKTKNSYRSTMTFEQSKTYRWRLIITLKNGNKIIGPPQVLNGGANQDRTEKSGAIQKQRGSFEVRCVAEK